MPRLLALLALVLVPVAAAAYQPGPNDYEPLPEIRGMSTVSRIEPRFSTAAGLVAGGKRFEARCWSVADWQLLSEKWGAGSDSPSVPSYRNPNDPAGSPRVQLSPGTCLDLARLTYRKAWRSTSWKLDLASAVVTLAYEAQHLRGFARDPTAECYGMQRARIVARSLGLTLPEANKLVETYWRLGYPTRPPRFRSAQCRQGGALDMNLSRSFP